MLQKAMKHRKLGGSRSWLVIISVWLLLSCMVSQATGAQENESIGMLRRMGNAFASVAEKVSPGVVGIVAKRTVARPTSPMGETPYGDPLDPFGEDFFDFFWRRSPRGRSPERDYVQRAQGSGFIISEKGYILTNNHMVNGADQVLVDLENGDTAEAEIIGTDPESDVAVIKIDPEKLNGIKPVALGDSEALQVGEWVLAIGNPMGLSHTVTAGIVSATGRSGLNIATYENFIQTDAAINMGNSGGPLVNLSGEAVGINTAIVGPGGGNIGIGFAIPIKMAKKVADQLIADGAVERGYLGVLPQDLTPELAEAFGVKETEGVLISQVTEGSAAAEAGSEVGDIVLQFAGVDVESASQFRNLVAARGPGEKVKMVVLRDGQRETLTVKLAKRPSVEELRGQARPYRSPRDESQRRLGLTVQDLTPELAERYGYEEETGVIITSVESGSEAAEKGLRQGYVIQEVNRRQVDNVRQFREAISDALSEGRPVLLLVAAGRTSQYVVLNPSED